MQLKLQIFQSIYLNILSFITDENEIRILFESLGYDICEAKIARNYFGTLTDYLKMAEI